VVVAGHLFPTTPLAFNLQMSGEPPAKRGRTEQQKQQNVEVFTIAHMACGVFAKTYRSECWNVLYWQHSRNSGFVEPSALLKKGKPIVRYNQITDDLLYFTINTYIWPPPFDHRPLAPAECSQVTGLNIHRKYSLQNSKLRHQISL
jgi:hypothetical protein